MEEGACAPPSPPPPVPRAVQTLDLSPIAAHHAIGMWTTLPLAIGGMTILLVVMIVWSEMGFRAALPWAAAYFAAGVLAVGAGEEEQPRATAIFAVCLALAAGAALVVGLALNVEAIAFFGFLAFFPAAPALPWAISLLWRLDRGSSPAAHAWRAVRETLNTDARRARRNEREPRRWQAADAGAAAAGWSTAKWGLRAGALLSLVFVRPLGSILSVASRHAGRRALQHRASSWQELRQLDDRPPVLYLRSFNDEGPDQEFTVGSWGDERLEEVVQNAAALIGPFIAIGKPGEPLPLLGAARDYVGDDQWRAHVREGLAEAKLAVLLLGNTEGLNEEIGMLVGGPREKAVFLLPPAPTDELAARFVRLCEALGPGYSRLAGTDVRRVLAVKFNAQGDCTLLCANSRSAAAYGWAIRVAAAREEVGKDELRAPPVLTSRGLPAALLGLAAMAAAWSWSWTAPAPIRDGRTGTATTRLPGHTGTAPAATRPATTRAALTAAEFRRLQLLMKEFEHARDHTAPSLTEGEREELGRLHPRPPRGTSRPTTLPARRF